MIPALRLAALTVAGGAGFPPSHVRWSVFRRRLGTSPSPTGRWPALGTRAGGAGGGGCSLAVGDECRFGAGSGPPTSGGRCFCRRRGTSPSPTLGRWRCRRPAWGRGPAVQGAVVVVSLAVGDECRRCRVPALHVRWYGVSPAAGDKPQPYRGRRCRRRCMGSRPPFVRWSVFRRRRGTSPSPTGGGVAAGGAGFPPSHVRWSVFRRRRGTSPSPTLGRWRCRRRLGMGSPASHGDGGTLFRRRRLGMSAAGGAGFPPSHVRWSCFAGGGGQAPALH